MAPKSSWYKPVLGVCTDQGLRASIKCRVKTFLSLLRVTDTRMCYVASALGTEILNSSLSIVLERFGQFPSTLQSHGVCGQSCSAAGQDIGSHM